MSKLSGDNLTLMLSGVGGYFGTKMVGGVVGKIVNQNAILKGLASIGVTAAILMWGDKYLNKYTMSVATGSAVASIINLLDGLASLTGKTPAMMAPGNYDAPSKMGSRAHAEGGLSGHDLMSVDNDENEDDLYEGIFASSET